LENLGLYISELLVEHDCVIVPGFGGFVARPASAHFAKAGNILLPPGKSLVFNKNLSNSDGLLANYLMQKLSISYREANSLLENWALNSKNQLEINKRLELEKTGVLYFSPDNILLFEPAQNSTHEVSSFGLSAVKAVKLVKEEIKSEKEFTYRQAEAKVNTGNKALMRISVVVSFFLLFSFLLLLTAKQLPISHAIASLNPFATKEVAYVPLSYNFKKLFSSKSPKMLDEVKKGTTLKFADNSSKVFVVTSDSAETDKTKVIRPVSFKSTSNLNYSGPFQIVVGCFAVEKNAHKLIGQLQKDSVAAGISGRNPNGLYVVSVAGFTTESLARAKLQQVKLKFPSAWILVK